MLDVKIICDFNPVDHLQTTVEVFGEVRLMNVEDESDIQSSHSLIARLGNLQMQLEQDDGLPERPPSGMNDKSLRPKIRKELEKEILKICTSYRPLIQVHTMKNIQSAREIIAENLHFRNSRKIRDKLKI